MAHLSPAFFYGSELEFLRAKYQLLCGLVDVVALTVTIAILHLLQLLVFRPVSFENFPRNSEVVGTLIVVALIALLLIGVYLETHWLLLPYVGYLVRLPGRICVCYRARGKLDLALIFGCFFGFGSRYSKSVQKTEAIEFSTVFSNSTQARPTKFL